MKKSDLILLKLQLKYLADAANNMQLAISEDINAFTEQEIDTALGYNLGRAEAHLANVVNILYPYLNAKNEDIRK